MLGNLGQLFPPPQQNPPQANNQGQDQVNNASDIQVTISQSTVDAGQPPTNAQATVTVHRAEGETRPNQEPQ